MTVGNEALHTLVFGTPPAPAGAFVSPRVEALLALLRERPGERLSAIAQCALSELYSIKRTNAPTSGARAQASRRGG